MQRTENSNTQQNAKSSADDVNSANQPSPRTTCEACAGIDLVDQMEVIDKTGFHYAMVRCRDCGLIQIDRCINEGSAQAVQWEGLFYEDFPKPKPKSWETVYDTVLARLPAYGASSGQLLDVGCSFGRVLLRAITAGFEVCGVDLSEVVLRYLREEHNIAGFKTTAEAAQAMGPFDVITCLETIYYMRNPFEELCRLRDMLKPNGILVIKSRANRTWLFRISACWRRVRGRKLVLTYGDRLHGYTCGGFYSFTTRNLRRMLARAGFTVLGRFGEDDPIPLTRNVCTWPTKLIRMFLTKMAGPIVIITRGRWDASLGVTLYATRQ